jgi:hypothetical protein
LVTVFYFLGEYLVISLDRYFSPLSMSPPLLWFVFKLLFSVFI